MEQLISFVVVAVLTGALAQGWKGHIGAIWGLISLPIQWFFYEVFFRAIRVNPGAVAEAGRPDAAFTLLFLTALASGLISAITMILIVTTLPNRKKAGKLRSQ